MTDTSNSLPPYRVLGMGNVLMGDDGLGPYVARLLMARYSLPAEVVVEDVGSPGLDLSPWIDGARAVIVLDTVLADGPPGTVRTWNRDQLLAAPVPDRSSPHQPGLRESLMAAELGPGMPEVVLLVGAVPASTETGAGLTDAVRASAETMIDTTVTELARLGVRLEPRPEPLDPDIWWE